MYLVDVTDDMLVNARLYALMEHLPLLDHLLHSAHLIQHRLEEVQALALRVLRIGLVARPATLRLD